MIARKTSISKAFSPYTYVRTSVMRSLLLKRQDYEKMMKMSSPEISKFLQESNYRNEINKLAIHYHGEELLEKAINENLGNTLKKLVRISKNPLAGLINDYAVRYDVHDLKAIIRGKFTNSSKEDMLKALSFAGTLAPEHLMALIKKDSIPEIIKDNGLFNPAKLQKALSESNERKSLDPLEWQLDSLYYRKLFSHARLLDDKRDSFIAFLYREIEVSNIVMLLRMKLANFSAAQIRERIIMPKNYVANYRVQKWMQLDSMENLINAISHTEYKDAISSEKIKDGSIVNIEIALFRHLYNKYIQLSHSRLLSAATVLAFMFAKDMEARNIRIILKGKQLGLSDDFIRGQLVLGG